MKSNFYGMLGICAKAGALVSGAFAAEKAIRAGKAILAIVANDASEGTKSSYEKLCNGYGVELCIYGSKEKLSLAIGKEERTIIVITDEGLSNNLKKKMLEED